MKTLDYLGEMIGLEQGYLVQILVINRAVDLFKATIIVRILEEDCLAQTPIQRVDHLTH